jgi:hypothetical protein
MLDILIFIKLYKDKTTKRVVVFLYSKLISYTIAYLIYAFFTSLGRVSSIIFLNSNNELPEVLPFFHMIINPLYGIFITIIYFFPNKSLRSIFNCSKTLYNNIINNDENDENDDLISDKIQYD